MRVILAAILATLFALPAAAEDYYIVQDTLTKKCAIVSERPTVSTTVIVGNIIYKSRIEAEAGLKTSATCFTQ
jgi:hypothetical protein